MSTHTHSIHTIVPDGDKFKVGLFRGLDFHVVAVAADFTAACQLVNCLNGGPMNHLLKQLRVREKLEGIK